MSLKDNLDSKRKQSQIEDKLSDLAKLAEDLSAELYSAENKITSEKFKKIAAYSRRICTCLRLHGQIPLERDNKIKKVLKVVDNAMKTAKSANGLFGEK